MISINALSFAPDVNDWLANSRHPRILHVFDQACNLINERKEILSIVTPQIGNGPFNFVIEDNALFSDHFNAQSPISICDNQLNLGDLIIHKEEAKLWSPHPSWEKLHAKRDDITKLLITNYQTNGLNMPFATNDQGYLTTASFQSLITNLSFALVTANIPSALRLTSRLAGLGIGLTPAGDDFILGALLATWIIHPIEIARGIAEEITKIAAPLTTSLSAAYLKCAGKGEAGILWHNFFDALSSSESSVVEIQITKLLSIGETSGADALAGFISTFIAYVEIEKNHVIPKHF